MNKKKFFTSWHERMEIFQHMKLVNSTWWFAAIYDVSGGFNTEDIAVICSC